MRKEDRYLQKKKRRIATKIRRIFMILFLAAGSSAWIRVTDGYQKGKAEYQRIEEEYTKKNTEKEEIPVACGREKSSEDKEKRENEKDKENKLLQEEQGRPAPVRVDWEKLKKTNPEIVAWIWIPDTDISYPVAQGDDNEYYLHHTVTGEEVFCGSIFMDADNDTAFQDSNTILYGHNMRDGSMFAGLHSYENREWEEEKSYFWIGTPQESRWYRIFSVHWAAAGDESYQISFETKEAERSWQRRMRTLGSKSAEWKEEWETADYVTLSTCTENPDCRLVVQGVQILM